MWYDAPRRIQDKHPASSKPHFASDTCPTTRSVVLHSTTLRVVAGNYDAERRATLHDASRRARFPTNFTQRLSQ